MKKTTLMMIALWIVYAIVVFRHWIEILNMEWGLPVVLLTYISLFAMIVTSEMEPTRKGEMKCLEK